MSSLQQKLDRALDWISKAVCIIYNLSILLIILLTLLFSFIAYHLFPPLILLILPLALFAAWYVTQKKDALAELIEDADEESAFPPGSRRTAHSSVPKRIVVRVSDKVLDSAAETLLLVPAGFGLVAILAFIFGYNATGAILLAISVILLGLVSCTCSIAESLTRKWIDTIFEWGHEPKEAASEKKPLLR